MRPVLLLPCLLKRKLRDEAICPRLQEPGFKPRVAGSQVRAHLTYYSLVASTYLVHFRHVNFEEWEGFERQRKGTLGMT